MSRIKRRAEAGKCLTTSGGAGEVVQIVVAENN